MTGFGQRRNFGGIVRAWILLIFGALLIWMGWDALRTLVARRLSSREVAEAVHGASGTELPERLEGMVRTRWLTQDTTLAQLTAGVFCLCGLVSILGGVMLLI